MMELIKEAYDSGQKLRITFSDGTHLDVNVKDYCPSGTSAPGAMCATYRLEPELPAGVQLTDNTKIEEIKILTPDYL